jgi:hypothetical protein
MVILGVLPSNADKLVIQIFHYFKRLNNAVSCLKSKGEFSSARKSLLPLRFR